MGQIAGEPKHRHGTRRAKLQAGRYVLKEKNKGEEESGVELLYRESSGELARCVLEKDVPKILHRYHDCHGHFAGGMMVRMLRGRYFWPTRIKDAMKYSRKCDACQRFGPLKPSAELKPILNL